MTPPDVIDTLAGLEPGSPLSVLRDGREQARTNAQRSFEVLLEPEDPRGFAPAERWAVAAFTALLHDFDPAVTLYLDGLREHAPELVEPVREAAAGAATEGPYGRYREPGLAGESRPGLVWTPEPALAATLGPRLAAALSHTHLLVLRPRESSADALAELVAAGWDADDVVSLSQLVAFLTFQVRAAVGLQALRLAGPAGTDRSAR